MKWTRDKLRSAAQQILKKHGYEKECFALDDLADEIGETNGNLLRKIRIYKWPGLFLLVLIPVISTSLSVAMTKDFLPVAIVAALSYVLTLLTLLNSIFAPRERFTSLCQMGIPLHDIAVALLAELETLPAPVQESDLHALVEKYDRLMLPYKKGLISMFLPQTDITASTRTPGKPELVRVAGRHVSKGQHAETKVMKQTA